MLGLVFAAGLVWGLLTNPREILAAWRRERAADQARREYRPAPPTSPQDDQNDQDEALS